MTTRAAEPAKEPSLETAKRDFGEVKAVTTQSAALQKFAEPENETPRLPAAAPVLPNLEPATSIKLEDKSGGPLTAHNKNWLVDAMMTDTNRGADNRTVDPRVDHRKRSDRSTANESTLDAASSEVAEKGATEKPPSTIEGANPLERYLTSWMTPGDYALLKPEASAELANSSGYFGSAIAPGQGEAGMGPLESRLPSSDTTPRGPAPVVAAMAENPYLKAMVESPATTPSSLVLPAPAVPPSAPATSEPKLANDPKDAAAEFQKARDDAKYFKQLRRF